MIDVPAFRQLLSEVVREVVRQELERALAARRPLSKAELAVALGKSTATIDRHVRDGMPFEQQGPHRVFDLDACRAWLRDRPRAEADDVLTRGVERKTRKRAA